MTSSHGSGHCCRSFRQKDLPRICEIHDAARLDELRFSNLQDAFVPLRIAAVREGLFDYQVLVAESHGRVDRSAAFSADELARLHVDPDCYRTGVGTLLAQVAIELSGQEVSLEVVSGNGHAVAFYSLSSLSTFVLLPEKCRAR
ncbi:GNAT family N-acetyltransferase [Labrenzia sp. OB1]|uniref:GNAT family N-acetyltransferase n=1 Tax=Labrenzia sp. OB1 TaxID=1561204 RepID=UPI0009ED633D|nr:GNAT family N-acetyltransferase [Labrenzia sp. OB1]